MLSRRDMLSFSAASVLPLHPRFAWAFADEDPTRVFTGDAKPTDFRLGEPKTLNGYFPFVVPKTKEAWEARRKQVREQLLVATGLWPLPEKTPLNAVVHGPIDKGDYTIEKVFFASMPGHYVSGNLYRPSGPVPDALKSRPAALFAHGHWANGRLHDAGEKAAKASVDSKSEPDMVRGRYFMQAIPVTLAKLGFVVFQYDMVGVADSTAIPHAAGFADVDGELRLQSAMGLQTWNSIRALDFLLSLPDVDPKRIGMTGASGGGTQTFMLAALDDRLACAFPAVMVSTGMQGGCVCENCSLLRVNTGNVEIAGLFAPKPMACSAANDWTKELMTKGYPELKQLYKLYGAEDKVAVRAWLEYGHQYNVHSRQMMYSWFSKHLLGKDKEIVEELYKPVAPTKDLSVYDDKHPRPADELDAKKLREVMTKASDEQLAKLAPKDAESLKEFKRVVGTALRAMVNLPNQSPKKWVLPELKAEKIGALEVTKYFLTREGEGTGVPVFDVHGPAHKGEPIILWVHPKGKAGLFENGKLTPIAEKLLTGGARVVAFDVLGVGELAPSKPFTVDKGFAGYTYGYNRSLLANRVHDILAVLEWAGNPPVKSGGGKVCMVGWSEMGPAVVLAKALSDDRVAKTAADLNQFRFENIKEAGDPMMLPGAVKYGGLPAFLALCAPGEVLAHNHRGTATGRIPKDAYDAAGAADKLTRSEAKLDDAKVVEWLVR